MYVSTVEILLYAIFHKIQKNPFFYDFMEFKGEILPVQCKKHFTFHKDPHMNKE